MICFGEVREHWMLQLSIVRCNELALKRTSRHVIAQRVASVTRGREGSIASQYAIAHVGDADP